MVSVSFTNPSPVQSLSDERPLRTARLTLTASFCIRTNSMCVVKYSSDALSGTDQIL
ncbi:hypothetical protein Mapa_010133 [Marchantia paleacea]|nr:hypothetical protein Mapa_010133 [Marchantia paleacea]